MTKPVEPIYQAFGARIVMLRDTLDVTQEELATRTGMSRASIANIEVGRQRVYTHQVAMFAKALGTTPRNLLKGIWW